MGKAEQILQNIADGNFTNIEQQINEALTDEKPEVLASLAEELTAYGFSDYSVRIYRQLIADFPQEDIFKVYLAEILINNDRTDDALALLYAIDKKSDAYVQSLLVAADYYQSEGFTEAAEQKLLEAHKLAPEEPVLTFALAELYYSVGEFNEALENYQLLVSQNIREFSGVDIDRRLANTWAQLGEFERAADLIKTTNTDDLDIDAKYEAGLIFLQAGRFEEAIEALNSVVEVQPDYVNVYPNLALAYQKQHDNDNVLTTAQIGLAHNKFDEVLYDLGAKAAANLGENKTVQKLLENGLAINHDNSGLRLQLSNLYVKEGLAEKNIDLFAEVSDEEIEDQGHWNLGVSYRQLENFTKAKEHFLLAYRSFSNNVDFLKQLIEFFQEMGDTPTLLLVLQNYLKIVPDDFAMQELFNTLEQ